MCICQPDFISPVSQTKKSHFLLNQFHRTRWAPSTLTSAQNCGVVMWWARSKNKGVVCLAVWEREWVRRGAGSYFLSLFLILWLFSFFHGLTKIVHYISVSLPFSISLWCIDSFLSFRDTMWKERNDNYTAVLILIFYKLKRSNCYQDCYQNCYQVIH